MAERVVGLAVTAALSALGWFLLWPWLAGLLRGTWLGDLRIVTGLLVAFLLLSLAEALWTRMAPRLFKA